MDNVYSIILGGGQGNRLFPLTRDRSKPAVPIGGKYRLIDIPVSNSINSGIGKVFILTQFNSVSLNQHIYSTYRFDSFSDRKVHLLAAEQTIDNANWYQGTADAVRRHISHYHWKPDDDVLILSGDHLYRMDFREIIQFHRERGADLTISSLPVPARITKQFGLLKIDRSHKVTGFLEKPNSPEDLKGFEPSKMLLKDFKPDQYLASMGIYVFKARVLEEILAGMETDFGKEIIPKAIHDYKAFGFLYKGYWRDIGTIRSFYEANIELTSKKPRFSFIAPEGPIFTHPRFLKPCKLEGAKLKNVLLSEGSVIYNAQIEDSVIGLRSVIGRQVKMKRVVMMGVDAEFSEGGVKRSSEPSIGDGTIIENTIIDKNARIGKNVKIQNKKDVVDMDGENFYIRDKIVIIPKNTHIPDGTVI